MRRACSGRGKGPAGDSLRRLDGVYNAWSDCYRRCAGCCIGDEARILPTFAHGYHARSERAVTPFPCATTMALRFLAGRGRLAQGKTRRREPIGLLRSRTCTGLLLAVIFGS
jgi:hypothetical protein